MVSAVLDLLRHVELQGYDGCPRALGLDDGDGKSSPISTVTSATVKASFPIRAAASISVSRIMSGATASSSAWDNCCDPTTMLRPASYGKIANGDLTPATLLKRSATMT